MNNLLTRTLFISLLLSTVTLPTAKDEKIKNDRWKKIAKKVGLVGIGTLGGALIGRLIAFKEVEAAVKMIEDALKNDVNLANYKSTYGIPLTAKVIKEGAKEGMQIGGVLGGLITTGILAITR